MYTYTYCNRYNDINDILYIDPSLLLELFAVGTCLCVQVLCDLLTSVSDPADLGCHISAISNDCTRIPTRCGSVDACWHIISVRLGGGGSLVVSFESGLDYSVGG